MTIESIEPFIGLIKDIATIIFYLVASGGTVFGLRTWKLQLLGEAKLEVYRELIKTVYRIQDLIKNARENNGFSLFIPGVDYKEKFTQASVDDIGENIIKAKELVFELKVINKDLDHKCIDELLDIAEDFRTSLLKYRALSEKISITDPDYQRYKDMISPSLKSKVCYKKNDDSFGQQLSEVVSKIESSFSKKIKL